MAVNARNGSALAMNWIISDLLISLRSMVADCAELENINRVASPSFDGLELSADTYLYRDMLAKAPEPHVRMCFPGAELGRMAAVDPKQTCHC